jgi:hypothetical protein
MSKQILMGIHVRGKRKTWGFAFMGEPQFLKEWQADGLDVFEIENVIPEWVADLGLVRPWTFLQDLWNFKNPWRK